MARITIDLVDEHGQALRHEQAPGYHSWILAHESPPSFSTFNLEAEGQLLVLANRDPIEFGSATGDWPRVIGFAVKVDGVPARVFPLNLPRQVCNGDAVQFAPGCLRFYLEPGPTDRIKGSIELEGAEWISPSSDPRDDLAAARRMGDPEWRRKVELEPK